VSPRQAAPPKHTWRSGFCGTGSHDSCRGYYAGQDCACGCHQPCPTCGQPLVPGNPQLAADLEAERLRPVPPRPKGGTR
jgi:hypothetical protein